MGEVTPPGSTNEDDIRLLDFDQPLASTTGKLYMKECLTLALRVIVRIFVFIT